MEQQFSCIFVGHMLGHIPLMMGISPLSKGSNRIHLHLENDTSLVSEVTSTDEIFLKIDLTQVFLGHF